MSQTFIILSVLLVVKTVLTLISLDDTQTGANSWMLQPGRRLFYQTRCTRRYTPGVCVEPVTLVWTYVYQIQNCTERFGCPYATRTNRFHSYRRCMRYCGVLADLYGQLLVADGRNSSDAGADRTPANFTARREGYEIFEYGETFELEREEEKEYMRVGDPPAFNGLEAEDEETQELEGILPPDIDYAVADRVPDQEDQFHDAFGRNYARRRWYSST